MPARPSRACPACPRCAHRRPRGFGFVEFLDDRDAEDAMHGLDRSMLGGREISVGGLGVCGLLLCLQGRFTRIA